MYFISIFSDLLTKLAHVHVSKAAFTFAILDDSTFAILCDDKTVKVEFKTETEMPKLELDSQRSFPGFML
jgi:hypothetical protein